MKPISKVESLADTVAWRNNFKVDGSTEDGRTQINVESAMAAAASMSVSQAESFLCKVQTLQWKWTEILQEIQKLGRRNSRLVSGRLIGFCGVETWKQVKKNWKKIEKARDETEVRTIVVTAIKEQQVDVDINSRRVSFGDNVVEDIWKCIFTYRLMENMAETERGILIMVFIRWTTQ